MRDLKTHPVTKQEEVELLRKLADEFESQANMGDSRPPILRSAAKRIEETPD